MAFNKEKFVTIFVAEVTEHLSNINVELGKLKKQPKNEEIIVNIQRELHTIKGSSRMLDFKTISKLSHSLEDIVKGISSKRYEYNEVIEVLIQVSNKFFNKALNKIKEEGNDDIDITKIVEACDALYEGQILSLDYISQLDTDSIYNQFLFDEDENNTDIEKIATIRTSISSIDSIIKNFDDIITNHFNIKKQLYDFQRELEDEHIQSELTQDIKDSILINENALFSLQQKILDLRMLPLSIILVPIREEIIMEAKNLNKEVELIFPTSNYQMDKMILEKLRNILIQIIRNGLTHGIETPEERTRKKKDPKGKIEITVTQTTNRISICVTDDGKGIDYVKIRQRAMELFPNEIDFIEEANESELQQYMFTPGFSTSYKTSELSGRGIGLDIVRSQMDSINGKIKVKSKPGKGTTFELNIPTSLATQQGIFIYADQRKFLIPSQYISEISIWNDERVIHTQNQLSYIYENSEIPLYFLTSILNNQKSAKAGSIIVVEYLEIKVAMAVDSIQEFKNVVVNTLPRVLKKSNAIQGLVYDENYAIIPILDIPFTIHKFKKLLSYEIKKYESFNEIRSKKILVVDDNENTRKIEKQIFEKEGYLVDVAEDGVVAMDKLHSFYPDLIVTDVNMPRMDGLILTKNLTRTELYSKIPIVILSGAYGNEKKQMFLDAGAKNFLPKSDFNRINLLKIVKELLNE